MSAQAGSGPSQGPPTPRTSPASGALPPWLIVWTVALVVVVAGAAFWFLVPHGPNGPPPVCESLGGCGPEVQVYGGQVSNVSGDWIYDFTISGTSGLVLGEFVVYVDLPNMETSVNIGAAWTLHALNDSGAEVGSFDLIKRVWTSGGTVPLSTVGILSLDAGTTSLSGDWFFVVGTGSFQGDAGTGIR